MPAKRHLIAFEKVVCDSSWSLTKSNPRFWKQDGVRNKFDAVYAPSYPEIEKAYVDAGKMLYRNGEVKAVNENADIDDFDSGDISDFSSVKEEVKEEVTEEVTEEVVSEEVEQEPVKKHWSELTFFEKRSLALKFTDQNVKTKDEVFAVLEKAEQDGLI